jgi:hypothetical protein
MVTTVCSGTTADGQEPAPRSHAAGIGLAWMGALGAAVVLILLLALIFRAG